MNYKLLNNFLDFLISESTHICLIFSNNNMCCNTCSLRNVGNVEINGEVNCLFAINTTRIQPFTIPNFVSQSVAHVIKCCSTISKRVVYTFLVERWC
jgi:hypothetical protein